MTCIPFSGGLDLKQQEAALRLGPDIVIATPGRLIDHLHNSPSFNLNSVEILVLDEADRFVFVISGLFLKSAHMACLVDSQTSIPKVIGFSLGLGRTRSL